MLATYRSLPLSHCAADWTFSSSVRPARVPFRPGTPVQNQTPGNPTAYRAHVPPLHAGVNFSHGGHPPEMLHALPVPPCPPPFTTASHLQTCCSQCKHLRPCNLRRLHRAPVASTRSEPPSLCEPSGAGFVALWGKRQRGGSG